MRRAPAAHLIVTTTLALTFALAGCSDGGTSHESDSTPVGESPLDQFRSILTGQSDEATLKADHDATQALVGTCMAEKGFDYTPEPFSRPVAMTTTKETRNTQEWVAAHGYGIVAGLDEVGETTGTIGEYVDPNGAYLATLSADGRQSFTEALAGVPERDIDPSDFTNEGGYLTLTPQGSAKWDWQTAGCYGFAVHELDDGHTDLLGSHLPLLDALSDLDARVRERPESLAVQERWSDCMADAGFSFTTEAAAIESIMSEHADARMAAFDTIPLDATDDPAYVYPGIPQGVAGQLKEKEITTALADFRCKQEVDWDQTLDAVRSDLEEQFVTDHKAELDAYMSDALQRRSE